MLHTKALDHLLSIASGDTSHSEALYLAANAVALAADARLTLRLRQYLLGDVDGVPKVTML